MVEDYLYGILIFNPVLSKFQVREVYLLPIWNKLLSVFVCVCMCDCVGIYVCVCVCVYVIGCVFVCVCE